ncbi:hypothetical protein SAMD00019534_004070 [Acytostelium subglobosum LB1]|uniref:hypothetical protein n=1 Tax=Acytostelium subglobosum LB1 TaxID=1410327 RepID=UPI000644CD82|nr:hypothetical protein SAMD00019534_004070 [Acytostelium subglobosum LB1]GAM17232.1 hypothetical protein SAMD00019534_004070 [Acytostelium subglobosum LB1]|eukprot:XP_012759294.1 hypothetical protein SAMD00019534_004070 [Acytostelium subglobosum LB1]
MSAQTATAGSLSTSTPPLQQQQQQQQQQIQQQNTGQSKLHYRSHSRNLSIGGGKGITILHDYAFSYHVSLPKQEQQQQKTSSDGKKPLTNHRGPIIMSTSYLLQLYRQSNPDFSYTSTLNPRRVLTQPSKGVLNDGFDNENSDFIIYVNDIIGSEYNQRYKVIDSLGQGTFGQVVKCQNLDTNELVAVKILKNKAAYYQQGKLEIEMLRKLNVQYDPENKSNILRLQDSFMFKNHLCIVMELLSINLFELIKQNSYKGLSIKLIQVFLIQILDSLIVLSKANMIHCDLKPENILLQSVNNPNIKLIDFGSACYESQTVYPYIQSRHYRSPEVLLGVGYTGSIDMWSLGCISAELFLGLPLFPGTSEYNQVSRIIDMRGMFPNDLLDKGKNTQEYFRRTFDNGKYCYTLKTDEEYSRDTNKTLQPSKKYFNYKTLPEIIQNYSFKKNLTPEELETEKHNRIVFTDFISGLLKMDPNERWSPMQAKDHPFITGSQFLGPFIPDPSKRPLLQQQQQQVQQQQQQQQQQQYMSTAPKPISNHNHNHYAYNGGSGSFNKSRGMPGLSFKHPIQTDQFNGYPESYSPRGMFSAPYSSSQSAHLALGQSPSLFGVPSNMFPPVPYSPLYNSSSMSPYFGSWGSDQGMYQQQQQQQQQQSSRRGRSKSDAPNSADKANANNPNNNPNIIPNNNSNNNNSNNPDDQYDDKPPMYPMNSPQRKRSQSGLAPPVDNSMSYGYQYLPPRMHLDHLGSNRFRSHSYGEQFQNQTHQSKLRHQHQQQQMQQHQQQHQQQQQQQYMQQNSPPIPNSPLMPHSPQFNIPHLMIDTVSPNAADSSSMNNNWNLSSSENEMLFPIEQLLPSQQQTPQLTPQQSSSSSSNPLTHSPIQSRMAPNPHGWKIDDMNSGFGSIQLGDQQGGWHSQQQQQQHASSMPWGIPPAFSITGDAQSHYDDMISFSPYDHRQNMFQSPPSGGFHGNYTIKNSPPRHGFSSGDSYLQNSSGGAPGGSYGYGPKYQSPQQHPFTLSGHMNQSPPTSSYNGGGGASYKSTSSSSSTSKNRSRNDSFSRTSPPTSRAHTQHVSPNKPISSNSSNSNNNFPQLSSTPLSPNTPPFIPQHYLHNQHQQSYQQQQQQHLHQPPKGFDMLPPLNITPPPPQQQQQRQPQQQQQQYISKS